MSPENYAQFQRLQSVLADLSDKFVPIETPAGNELFQRMSDAAFQVVATWEAEAARSDFDFGNCTALDAACWLAGSHNAGLNVKTD